MLKKYRKKEKTSNRRLQTNKYKWLKKKEKENKHQQQEKLSLWSKDKV